GTVGNITISNPAGTAGDPTFDLGSSAVQTDQANTYTTGAQNFAAATSVTVPTAARAVPTTSGQIAYDSTANASKVGQNGRNGTSFQITLVHESLSSAAGNRFSFPSGQNLILAPGQGVFLTYEAVKARWVPHGSGGSILAPPGSPTVSTTTAPRDSSPS